MVSGFAWIQNNFFGVVQSLSHVQLFATPWTVAHQASLSFTIFWACSNSCPLNWWYHSIIHSQFFASGGQSTGASASALVLPVNMQCWYTLGLTSLISLQSKGLSRVLSSTTIWKHQFFGAQFSFWSNSHIHTWLLEKPWYTEWKQLDIYNLLSQIFFKQKVAKKYSIKNIK